MDDNRLDFYGTEMDYYDVDMDYRKPISPKRKSITKQISIESKVKAKSTKIKTMKLTADDCITSVSYGKTINMGNYESVRVDLTAKVKEGVSWKEVLEELQMLLMKEEKRIKREGV